MHVALLADTGWLEEELPMFEHLVVGLIDEQVQLTQVLPAGTLDREASVFGQQVCWDNRGLHWQRRRSLIACHRILEQLGVELLHALDGRLWEAAAEIGRRNDLPVIYAAFDAADGPRAARLAARLDPTRAAFTAASAPLAELLQTALGERFTVGHLHSGVHRQPDHRRQPAPGQPLTIAIAGTGTLDEPTTALLQAALDLTAANRDIHFFFDGQDSQQRQLWRHTRRLGLLSHATFVPRRLGHREWLPGADLLIHPQATGRVRGLTLEAMAHSVPILAHADPIVDHLIDGVTARLIHRADTSTWTAALGDLIHGTDARIQLADTARHWVLTHRLASDAVTATLHTYRAITGHSLPFAEP